MSEQLSQTKELIQSIVNKVQILDFILNGLNLNHKIYADKIEEQFQQASNHKLKLTAELLRLSGAEIVEVVVPNTPPVPQEPLTVA